MITWLLALVAHTQALALDVNVPPVVLGARTTVEVTNAAPLEPTYFFAGLHNGATPACPASIAPDCTDLLGSVALQNAAQSDALGRAQFSIPPLSSRPPGQPSIQVIQTATERSAVIPLVFLRGDFDEDGDGVSNLAETVLGTDPLDPDSDDDGLTDGEEIVLGTDPTSHDTDRDHLPDGAELDRGTDPNDWDTDGDRLPDGWEIYLGTDALDDDSDDDGLLDGREYWRSRTDPLRADTDNDGLTDGEESATDPLDPDTDDDGCLDGVDQAPFIASLPDDDGDGTPMDCEQCAGDDTSGDADNDGVCNDLDACAAGPDDMDADFDGTPDGCDTCPGADDRLDADGDGQPNACDPCPIDSDNDPDGDGLCGVPGSRWFVTDGEYRPAFGDFRSVPEADEICQDEAQDAGRPGTWIAWMSTEAAPARARLRGVSAPFYRSDGDVFAESLESLLRFGPENGLQSSSSTIWTGTDNQGRTRETCSDWRINTEPATYGWGRGSTWSARSFGLSCSNRGALMCVETTNCTGPCFADTCGDGTCDRILGEASTTCPADCTFTDDFTGSCGDGLCAASQNEDPASCPTDCGQCGDFITSGDEECDDGLGSRTCTDDCRLPRCGDGHLAAFEVCDDGNLIAGDGCSPSCELECSDLDGDTVCDEDDPCPLDATDDSDGDGVCDSEDICPSIDDLAYSETDLGSSIGAVATADTCADAIPDTRSGVCGTSDFVAFRWTAPADSAYRFEAISSEFLPELSINEPTPCGGANLACSVPGGALEYPFLQGESIVIFVGGSSPGALGCGSFTLEVSEVCSDEDFDGFCIEDDICPHGDDLADADADGTPDACDACPHDPAGDSDGDGICDSADPCPSDSPNDTDGDGVCDSTDPCPLDLYDDVDGDGVCDSDDQCFGTDDTADADADGVCDGIDQCPGSDDTIDDDDDRVPDGCDTCPGFPDDVREDLGSFLGRRLLSSAACHPGPDPDDARYRWTAPYDGSYQISANDFFNPRTLQIWDCDVGILRTAQGGTWVTLSAGQVVTISITCGSVYFDAICSDSDDDGVCNGIDICPGFDDANDTDGDGVPDGCDMCPLDPLDDQDLDTVCDGADICPGEDDTLDADGDGVPDGCDACPLDATDDSDGDGVCDSDDPCPFDNPDNLDGDAFCGSFEMFVSADDIGPGDFGSVEDADAFCQAQAEAASLTGRFMAAVVPDAFTSLDDRVDAEGSDGPWYRLDGTFLMDNAGVLDNAGPAAPIHITQFGTVRDGVSVWTGHGPPGGVSTQCSGWTSTTGTGIAGDSGQAGPTLWSNAQSLDCATSAAVYCLELEPLP